MSTLDQQIKTSIVKSFFDDYLAKVPSGSAKTISEICQMVHLDVTAANYVSFATALGLNETTANTEGATRTWGAPAGATNTALLPTNYRLIIAANDGTVVYDSSKTTNSAVNVGVVSTLTGKYQIGENHLTRPELLLACLNQPGVGTSSRLSLTTKKMSHYVAYRVGSSSNNPVGFIRGSVEDQNEQASL